MKKVELFNDHFQNFKVYGIPHAQLIIADPPCERIKDLQMRLDRAEEKIAEMVESRREFLDV